MSLSGNSSFEPRQYQAFVKVKPIMGLVEA
jgi:hypothetical protein